MALRESGAIHGRAQGGTAASSLHTAASTPVSQKPRASKERLATNNAASDCSPPLHAASLPTSREIPRTLPGAHRRPSVRAKRNPYPSAAQHPVMNEPHDRRAYMTLATYPELYVCTRSISWHSEGGMWRIRVQLDDANLM